MRHRSVVFVLSDFVAPAFDRELRLLASRHDVVAVTLEDPGERLLPDIGVARLVDPETGETIEVNTSDAKVREQFIAGRFTNWHVDCSLPACIAVQVIDREGQMESLASTESYDIQYEKETFRASVCNRCGARMFPAEFA